MGIDEIIARLTGLGVTLRLEHGRLVAAAAKGVIDDGVKAMIAGNKQGLVDYLGGLTLAPEAALSIAPGSRGAVVPLSYGQEGLLFLDELEKGSTNYNMAAGLRIEGALDVDALRRAIEAVVARQEALRIRIVREGGKTAQLAVDPERFELSIASVSGDSIEEEVRRDTEEPFELDGGPLFRARLLRVDENEHVLVIALHHVIGDGWSLGILAQEISAAYPAAAGLEADVLPAIEVSYLDYVHWMHERMEQGLLAQQLAYWKSTLEGAPAVLDFGLDRRRPARRSNRGSSESLLVPASLLDAVQAHAREEGTTLFMYLLAAFNILAARYSGQDDIVLGTPVANRNYAEVEPLIGFFVNTMVLRNRVPPTATVRELLRSVKASTLGALRNADVSFPQLVEQLAPERSLSHSPIFQVNFGLQNAPTSELTLGDLKLVPVGFTTQSTKFDLSVNAAVENGGLVVGAEYSTDLYDAETVRAILADYSDLVQAMVGRSDAKIAELSIASLERRMAAFSGSIAAPEAAPGVLSLVSEAARRFGDRPAAEQGERTIGHAELALRSDRLATSLASLGSGPGRIVAIAARPSRDFVAAILAILKTGAAYLPLDPEMPEQRLSAILADASPLLVICDEEDVGNAAFGASHPRSIASLAALSDDVAAGVAPAADPDPSEVAYIIYTSGSTGSPKGVEVTHGGLANLVAQLVPSMKLSDADRVLQFTPTTFDVSVQEIFSTLAAGACLVFPPRGQVKVGEPLARFLRERVVTVATLPPSVLVSTSPETLPHLRLVVTGAEAISGEVVDAWGCGRDFFYNYGPTETTVTATAKFCAPGGERPTIGRPLDNVRVHIVDAALAPVPVNVVGEVMIGGAGVARGYVADPAKTAAAFIPDPFSVVPGARLYRTGDLARFRADGEIEFVGRNDTQVKLRGFRIELGEVEAALRCHPAVADAVAMVAEDAGGQPRLVAYVRADAAVTDAVREHMRSVVPHYMVPAVIVALDTFPVTANGKVDKNALPSAFSAAAAIPAPAEAAGLEAEVAMIFSANIGVDSIGGEESFFEAGGDSLLAVQTVSQINEQFGIELNLAEIFEFPTARELARRIEAGREEMARLLGEIEAMSEAEATILLQAQ